MTGRAVLMQGDARSLPLADGSVDLIVSSPPYFGLRDYGTAGQIGAEPHWRDFLDALVTCTAEMVRVLKPEGSIFVNLGDKYGRPGGGADASQRLATPATDTREKSLLLLPERYRIACVDTLGLIARAVIVWDKPNGLPESVKDRVRRSHEDWVHLTKSPRYFSAVDEIREAYAPETDGKNRGRNYPASANPSIPGGVLPLNPLDKLPGSVWTIPSEPLRTPEYMLPRHADDMNPQWFMADKDAWWLLRHGIIPPTSAWPRDDNRGELRAAPAHYAAFPSEWCRRLILGWSPPAICTVCGQGRWPVVDRRKVQVRSPYNGNSRGMNDRSEGCFATEATILGYACACTPHTDHPGTGEPSGKFARYADSITAGITDNPGGGLANRPKVGPRREYHLDRWTPPHSRPAVVLDPFGGTGATAMVAAALDRTGISLDLSANYTRLANWRAHQSGHAAKTVARTNRERQGALL